MKPRPMLPIFTAGEQSNKRTHHVSIGWLSRLPHVVLEVLPARAWRESRDDDAVLRLLEAGCPTAAVCTRTRWMWRSQPKEQGKGGAG